MERFDDRIFAVLFCFGVERFGDIAWRVDGTEIPRYDIHTVAVYRKTAPLDLAGDESAHRIMREPFCLQIFHDRSFAAPKVPVIPMTIIMLYLYHEFRADWKNRSLGCSACAIILALFVFLPELNALCSARASRYFSIRSTAHIKRRMRKIQGLAAFFTILIAAIVIIVPLIFFCEHCFPKRGGLYTHLTAGGIAPLENLIEPKMGEHDAIFCSPVRAHPFTLVNLDFSQYITQAVGTIVTNAGMILSQYRRRRVDIFPRILRVFYLLKDGEKLRKLIVRGVPLADEHAEEVCENWWIWQRPSCADRSSWRSYGA